MTRVYKVQLTVGEDPGDEVADRPRWLMTTMRYDWQTKRQTHHFIKLNSSFFMQTLQEKVIGLCTRMAALSLSWKPPIDYFCSTSLRADITNALEPVSNIYEYLYSWA